MLDDYLTHVQDLVNQTNTAQPTFPSETLTRYINRARKQVAKDAGCVRILLPPNGSISGVLVSAIGSGYSVAPTVIFSTPDGATTEPGVRAAGTANLSGGAVVSVTMTATGNAYFQPTVRFSGATTGTVASGICLLSTMCATSGAREVYTFTQFSALARQSPGVNSIFAVRSVAFLWGSIRYVRKTVSFSEYQANIRNWVTGFQFVPEYVAQLGQGENGSLYMTPVPSQRYPMEWDCSCLPIELATNSDPEAIPDPWRDPVPYHAAYQAMLGSRRSQDAAEFLAEYKRLMKEANAAAMPGAVTSFYGRG